MLYLYLWKGKGLGEIYSYDAILHDDKYRPSPEFYSKIGPYETIEDAKNAWILLGRKTKDVLTPESYMYLSNIKELK